jgi:oligopeptide transport system substrate-binding protein
MIAGCGRQTRVEVGAREQILHIGNGAEPKDLDPATQAAEIEYVIDTALFEGLVNIANDGDTILPGVAERWDVSPDGRTYTFHLRSDARWSDGGPVIADDFVYSFRRVFTPSMGCQNNVYGFMIKGSRAMNEGKDAALGVAAIDARTLRIELEYRAPYLLYILAGAPFVPVPRAVVERFGGGTRPGSPWTRPGKIVCNGPFILSSWRPNQEVVATRNPYYWDARRTRLREIHFYPTDDVESEERAFRAGQLHITYGLPTSKIASYRERGDPQLHVTPQLDTTYVLFNVKVPPFNDTRIRRALALAIDREKIVPAVGKGSLDPAHSLTRPGTGGYTPPAVVDFDPSLAQKLLAEAGYPGGKGFPPATIRISRGPLATLVEAIQNSWQEVLGINIGIEVQEQKTFFDAIHSKDYHVAFTPFFYGVNAAETILMIAQGESLWNDTGWKSPAFDQAYHDASFAPDETVRRAAFDRMERLIHDEAPYIPIGFLNQPHLISSKVRGWRDNALYAIDWRELWLEP